MSRDVVHRYRSRLALLCVALTWMTAGVAAQSAAPPSTATGEWPAYGGDIGHTRYAPLDQIDASNFGDLEVAWRFKTDNLGPGPEFKLEGTPLMVGGMLYATGGTRRSVVALDAATGELRWVHGEHEGERASGAPRLLSGRGLSSWTSSEWRRRRSGIAPVGSPTCERYLVLRQT